MFETLENYKKCCESIHEILYAGVRMKHNILFFLIFLFVFIFLALPANAAHGTSIVPNPSLENISTSNSELPQFWTKEMSANADTTFSYLKTGHTGNRSLDVNINSYKCGDAHYKFDPQPVVPGVEYEFSFYYQSMFRSTL